MNYGFLIFEFWHYIFGIIGCFLNGLLIFISVFHSPKAIHSYATLIINFALTDFFECFLDLYVQIRLIPTPGDVVMIYILNGLCQFTGPTSCKIGVSLFLHCIPHAVWSLLFSFGYRYYILTNPPLSRKQLIIIIGLIYIPSLFQGLTYWTNFVDEDVILPLAKQKFPNYNFSAETGVITGIIDVTNWSAAYAISHLCLPITPVYIAIYFLRKKIIQHLTIRSHIMSKETRATHSQLLKVLTFQSIIPVCVWIGATIYVIYQLGIIVSPILEYTIFASVLLMPVLSPITYLFFVRPYRNYWKGLIPTPVSTTLIYVFNGLCRFTGPTSCKIGTSLLIQCFSHSTWSLLLSFSYRYYLLHHPGLPRKTLVCIILLIYLPSFFQATIYWTGMEDPDVMIDLAYKYYPQYNLSNSGGVVGGLTTMTNFASMYTVLHNCIPIFPVYVIIFILRQKITKNLIAKARLLTREAKRGHSQMLKCLTIQAMIPSLLLIDVVCFLFAQFGIVNNPNIEYFMFSAILPMPVISPLTYLIFVRSYRRVWMTFFEKLKIVDVNKMTSVSRTDARSSSFSQASQHLY